MIITEIFSASTTLKHVSSITVSVTLLVDQIGEVFSPTGRSSNLCSVYSHHLTKWEKLHWSYRVVSDQKTAVGYNGGFSYLVAYKLSVSTVIRSFPCS